MEQYSTVKIIKLNKAFEFNETSSGVRVPKVGDVATIIDVYEGAFDLECSDTNGCTVWLELFHPKDAEFEVICI